MTPTSEGPERVVVVGAAGGIGRFLAVHLLDGLAPLVLVDVDPGVEALAGELRAAEAVVADWLVTAPALDERTLVVSALRFDLNDQLFRSLARSGSTGLCVCDVASTKVPVLDLAATRLGDQDHSYFGLHPLFGPTVRGITGQTVVACPGFGPLEQTYRDWFVAAVEARGGFGRTLAAPEHDFVMAYLQTASHQALLTFADVLSRGPFTPEYLWQMRTPLFEMLLSLVGRVMVPSQQATIASIELSTYGLELVSEYQASFKSLSAALVTGSQVTVEEFIERVRDSFTSASMDALERTAALAVTSVQDARYALAQARSGGQPVSLRHVGSGRIHAGRILELSSVDVVIEDHMLQVGEQIALLLPGARDARKQRGLQGPSVRTALNLANTEILGEAELERVLNERSVSCHQAVSVQWPWSAVDRAALAAVRQVPGVLNAGIAHERVWDGRREVILDVEYRIDCDPRRILADVQAVADIDRLRSTVSGGLVGGPRKNRAGSDGEIVVNFLGPPGTFSEAAAARVASGAAAVLRPWDTFGEALDRAAGSPGELAVVPLVNSLSGIVDLAASAIAERRGQLRSVGVVDVPVALTLYGGAGVADLDGADGRTVYSHPQAAAQCARLVAARSLRLEPVASTSAGLAALADDPDAVAIAAPGLDLPPGVRVLHEDVTDDPHALTRFIAVAARGDEPLTGRGPLLWVLPTDQLVRDLGLIAQPGARIELFTGERHVVVVTDGRTVHLDADRSLGPTAWQWIRPV